MISEFELKFMIYAFVPGDEPGEFDFKHLNSSGPPISISLPLNNIMRKYCEAAFLGVMVAMGKRDKVDLDYSRRPDLLIAVDQNAKQIDLNTTPSINGILAGTEIHLLLNDKGFPFPLALKMLINNVAEKKSKALKNSSAESIADNKISYDEFLLKIETTIRNIIRRCCPRSWDENHITYSITDELALFNRVEITRTQRPFFITWDARKFVGPTENNLGDLGILIRMTSWDGEYLEGIGLLEAKKRPLDGSNFTAVKKNQLIKINNNAPHSKLLLYDHSNITEFGDNLISLNTFFQYDDIIKKGSSNNSQAPLLPWSQAVTVPIDLALNLDKYTTSLYKYSIPFSVQLCGRYFRGLDLEFDKKIVKAAKGFSDRFGGPRFLMIIGISSNPDNIEQSENVNTEVYRPLNLHLERDSNV